MHRRYLDKPVEPALLRLLCACALSAPSKSDLQQADILVVRDPAKRRAIEALLPEMPWISEAPVFLVFLASGRRLPVVAELRGKPFPNDHLDQFHNAVSDASIVLATFLRAATAVGLGCCPISVIRDHAAAVSELLELPQRVIPLAGMCVGWPAGDGGITARLGLAVTLHEDRYDDGDLAQRIDAYDHRRRGAVALRQAALARALGRGGILRLVGGQGPAICRPAARGFRCLRAREGIWAGLTALRSVSYRIRYDRNSRNGRIRSLACFIARLTG